MMANFVLLFYHMMANLSCYFHKIVNHNSAVFRRMANPILYFLAGWLIIFYYFSHDG